MVLEPGGNVRHILVIKPLSAGLTGQAVEAARLIVFKPAVKDGRRVAQVATVSYNFITDSGPVKRYSF